MGLLLETQEAREEMWKLLGASKSGADELPVLSEASGGAPKAAKGAPKVSAKKAKRRAVYAGGIPYM